jgi:hypothetical protein
LGGAGKQRKGRCKNRRAAKGARYIFHLITFGLSICYWSITAHSRIDRNTGEEVKNELITQPYPANNNLPALVWW